MRDLRNLLLRALAITLLVLASIWTFAQNTEEVIWVAPPEAEELVNPLNDKQQALLKGKKIYAAECVVCHGTYGNAKTDIAKNLEQKPKNFTHKDFSSQSDGAIFWKLSEGRGLMQPFKTMLTDEEIWSLVVYVRELAKENQ